MSVSLADKGNYYRGLLILARRDREIDPRERELAIQLGMMLDFDRRFCEAAIDDALKNRHLSEEPIKFSDRETAERFLRDGIRLALVDDEITSREYTWLRVIAGANGISNAWLGKEIKRCQESKGSPGEPGLTSPGRS
jgi:hypothetical protein